MNSASGVDYHILRLSIARFNQSLIERPKRCVPHRNLMKNNSCVALKCLFSQSHESTRRDRIHHIHRRIEYCFRLVGYWHLALCSLQISTSVSPNWWCYVKFNAFPIDEQKKWRIYENGNAPTGPYCWHSPMILYFRHRHSENAWSVLWLDMTHESRPLHI